MGCGSEVLSMIFIITLLMLLSLQRTHILTVDPMFNGLQEMYFMEEKNEQENENQVKKISGLDENEEKEALIVEKFRALLGLESLHSRVPSNGDSQFLSPSVSPSPSPNTEPESPAPAPAPSPVLHLHPHSHHPRHHSHWNSPLNNKTHGEDRGRAKRILVAVLVSVGIAATLICACGLILVCRNFRNQRKKPKRAMPLCSKTKGTGGGSYQNSSSKVSLNSGGLDLFYLNALGNDIEQQDCSLKRTCENSTECYDNVSSSYTKEILPVHEDVEESVNCESESESDSNDKSCSRDKIIPEEECHSSDDESFHSLVDSQSNLRLSSASAGSLSDTLSLSPQNSSSSLPILQFPPSPHNSISKTQSHQSPYSPIHEEQEIETSPKTLMPPPPPPPPPPPFQMPLFTLHSLTTSSSRVSSHSPLSLTSHNLSSPRNSDTFSGSNHSPEKELLSPPQPNYTKSPPNIPPPPCPPPFIKGNNNSVKTPPPPPSQLPQFTPLGKDGAPLPKLKPLHWDKVRAAPNGTMVWDKLRSSSFE